MVSSWILVQKVGDGRKKGKMGAGWEERTVGLFVLLILSHGFEAGGTGKEFVGEVSLVVGVIGLRAILSVDVTVCLRCVV